MSKLRVFGETFAPESPFFESSNQPIPRCNAQVQTSLTYFFKKEEKKKEIKRLSIETKSQTIRSSFIGSNFLGWRLGDHSMRRERIRKSQSTRVTQAEASLGDIIRHNKVNFG